jgi:DNA-binding response OmpR family regulator
MDTTSNERRSILVLEDDRPLAKAVRETFSARGFYVVAVATIDDAVRELKNLGHVDVVWLDHFLLGTGNGLDFVFLLKNNPKWSDIPIFVVSNATSTSNVCSYIKFGVYNYYTKTDHDIGQIVNDVEQTLVEVRKHRNLPPEELPTPIL